MIAARGWSRFALMASTAMALIVGLSACEKQENGGVPGVAQSSPNDFNVLAGSELKDVEPLLMKAAQAAGIPLKLYYAGTLDIVERVNAGEKFDAILPPNGAYPALSLGVKPLAKEKLFYSRVALGVKTAKLKALGWDKKSPTWAEIAKAAGSGAFRFGMTNPTSSNTGMSALFAVASAVAGKTENLTAAEVDGKVLTAFLSGQKLMSGSSGWLSEAFVKDPSAIDGMVNYEAVILRTNDKLADADKMTLVYPMDGVISADYPLMLLNEAKREVFGKLVAALKAPSFQTEAAATAFLRPSIADVPLAGALPKDSVAELTFPNNLGVIDSVLSAYQGEWRRPSTSIFVLDVSQSMEGERLESMRKALKVLAGGNNSGGSSPSARYTQFQSREHVVLISFASDVDPTVQVNFDAQKVDDARRQVTEYADALNLHGGTAIYAALLKAKEAAAAARAADPNRFVSIVLLTDGENNVRPNLDEFKGIMGGKSDTRIFPILFGEGVPSDMNALAAMSGGKVFDGKKSSLAQVFKEIRGYQ